MQSWPQFSGSLSPSHLISLHHIFIFPELLISQPCKSFLKEPSYSQWICSTSLIRILIQLLLIWIPLYLIFNEENVTACLLVNQKSQFFCQFFQNLATKVHHFTLIIPALTLWTKQLRLLFYKRPDFFSKGTIIGLVSN